MGKMHKILLVAICNMRKWMMNPRIYLVFIMVALYLHSIVSPIVEFCEYSGYRITPFLFPYIMSHSFSVMIIMFGVVLLFCDAPFIELDQPYIILRSGRKIWLCGQLVYIIIASFIYIFFILLVSIIIFSSYLEWDITWGKVIGTFAQTSVGAQHGIAIPFSFYIYNGYSPISAMLTTFFNSWLVSTILGSLMFALNLRFSRASGLLWSSILVLWQVAATKTWSGFTYFSPVSWVSLSQIDTTGNTLFPSLSYVWSILAVLLVLLTLFCFYTMDKKDIAVLKSV